MKQRTKALLAAAEALDGNMGWFSIGARRPSVTGNRAVVLSDPDAVALCVQVFYPMLLFGHTTAQTVEGMEFRVLLLCMAAAVSETEE